MLGGDLVPDTWTWDNMLGGIASIVNHPLIAWVIAFGIGISLTLYISRKIGDVIGRR